MLTVDEYLDIRKLLASQSESEGMKMAMGDEKAPAKKKKRKSKFNKAVKVGMDIVRKSTSYGRKGTINNPKKAFAMVTKVSSAVNQGKAKPKNGIKRKVALAVVKVLGPVFGRLRK